MNEESEKVDLELNIQKTKIMVSGPITSWQIDGEIMEIVTGFIFLGSKITADGDWGHEIKRCLLLGRKVMTDLDSILKSRDTTLPTKVHLVKALVFPVVMHGCESVTTESRRNGAFEPGSWRRKWQPTPVFLPGKSHGWWNLAGYSPWSCKELDMTEQLHFHSLEGKLWPN